jgi:hypothetical protein
MLLEPASALTDLALGLVAVALAWRSRRWSGPQRYWCFAFAAAGAGALLGAAYHAGVKTDGRVGSTSWTLITLCLAVMVSFLLAGTVATVVGPDRGRFWLWLRSAGLTVYAVAALSGHAGLGSLLASESLTMAAILVLWWRAWRRGVPHSEVVVLAIATSAVGGAIRVMPIEFTLGLAFNGTALYHLAQIPGLLLLYRGIREEGDRSRVAALERGAAPAAGSA